jgi:predicted GNAT superfamily acetyltransferase
MAGTKMEEFEIRPFSALEDFSACVRMQQDTWGPGFSECVPVAILKVSQILDGVVAGAYDEDGELLGFIYGLTGPRDGEIVHWSDMLAVRPDLQGSGLGWRLKAYQREVLLERGITTMFWTFDPLESRNAYLNLNKLGAVACEYVCDMYGQTDSPLHHGIGTDRFVPRWDMASESVEARMAGDATTLPEVSEEGAVRALGPRRGEGHLLPDEPVIGLTASHVLVAIPESIQAIKDDSIDSAVAWRQATRTVFTDYLSRGYEARALLRRNGWSDYLLVSS